MSKEFEIVMRIKIIYTGEEYPDDDLVITPIKRAIREKVSIFKASHELDFISDKVQRVYEPEPEHSQ